MRPSVLVTGGAGYIGSHTCKALARAGMLPVAFDNLSSGHTWAVKWGPLVHEDLVNEKRLRETIQAYDIKAVLHFAAHAYVGESMSDPRKYFLNNITNSLSLLSTCLDSGISAFVFSSSCATYGNPKSLPIAEEHPQQPINPYGESKLAIEKVLRWYDASYGFKSAVLRYFNAAGADPDGEIGESHDPETHLIPLVIAAAQGVSPHVRIFGTDFDTPDGTAVRDYVHVSDLASAHVRAVQELLTGAGSITLNLGTGTGHSVRQVISEIEVLSGRRIKTVELSRRPGDPPALYSASSRADAALGWRPVLSDLRTIAKTAWAWHEGTRGSTL